MENHADYAHLPLYTGGKIKVYKVITGDEEP